MLLQTRINRAFKKSRETKNDLPKPEAADELYLEKGDFTAMWLAGIQMILLPALLVLLAMTGLGLLIFWR